MRSRLLNILLYFFLSLLLFAGIQGVFKPVKEKDLLGVVTVSEKCSLSLDSLTDGRFQQCVTLWVNNHLGFRNSLIRVNSQITFSIFGMSPSKDVLIGSDNNLFETNYINSWLGKDNLSRKKIEARVQRLVKFQKIMDTCGVHFLLVFCPSKVRFMPENLPAQFRLKRYTSSYDTYIDVINKQGQELHFLDFNKYFRLLKDTSPYTIYPKGGTHWTNFSSRYYALDSMLRYMEHLSGERYPRLVTERIYWSDSLLVPDDDISTLFNLIFPFPSGKITYAEFGVDSAGAVKPDVLAISDSYYWQIYGFDKIGKIFNTSDFWVWNELFLPKSRYENIRKDDYPFLKQNILSHDFVILMVTEINLPHLLNFDEKTFALFDPDNPVVKELQRKRQERINFFKTMIKNDPRWSAQVREKARIRKLTYEQMVQNDAEYMVEYEISNNKGK